MTGAAGIPPCPPFAKGEEALNIAAGSLPLENERSEVSRLRPKGGQEGFHPTTPAEWSLPLDKGGQEGFDPAGSLGNAPCV